MRSLLLMLMIQLAPSADPKDRVPIVDKSIAFHGGELCDRSKISLSVVDQSEPGRFSIEAERNGGIYAYDIKISAKLEGRAIVQRVRSTNTTIAKWQDGEALELDEEEQSAARDLANYAVYFPLLPCRLNDPTALKEDLGLEAWGKKKLHKVRVTFKAGTSVEAADRYLYWFDPETGRLEQLAYDYGPDGNGVRFLRATKFHKVGGMVFADRDKFEVVGKKLSSDLVTPEYVAKKMKRIATVQLKDLKVVPLEPPKDAASQPSR